MLKGSPALGSSSSLGGSARKRGQDDLAPPPAAQDLPKQMLKGEPVTSFPELHANRGPSASPARERATSRPGSLALEALLLQSSGDRNDLPESKGLCKPWSAPLKDSFRDEFQRVFFRREPAVLPDGALRSLWDPLIMFLVVYCILVVPVELAWVVPILPWGVFDVLTDFFFIVDVYINFHTAYLDESEDLVSNFASTYHHYVMTWFFFDLAASLPYDFVIIMVQITTSQNVIYLKLLKLFRLFRVATLIRFLQQSELSMATSMLLLACAFVVASHWACCFFWLIAVFEGLGSSWVVTQRVLVDLQNATQNVQYTTSLYWSVVTLTTLGYGDVTASTLPELIYTSIIVLLGATFYAVIIGFIGILVASRFASATEFSTHMEPIEAYERLNKIPAHLRARIRGYHRYYWQARGTFSMQSLMEELPFELKVEVGKELHSKMFEKTPYLSIPRDTLTGFQRAIASHLESGAVKLPDEILFFEGEPVRSICFVRRGLVGLVVSLDDVDEIFVGSRTIGQHCGDTTVNERHSVSAIALEFSDVHFLPVAHLETIFERFPEERALYFKVAVARQKAFIDLVRLVRVTVASLTVDPNRSRRRVPTVIPFQRGEDGIANLWRLWEESVLPMKDNTLVRRVIEDLVQNTSSSPRNPDATELPPPRPRHAAAEVNRQNSDEDLAIKVAAMEQRLEMLSNASRSSGTNPNVASHVGYARAAASGDYSSRRTRPAPSPTTPTRVRAFSTSAADERSKTRAEKEDDQDTVS